MCSRSDIIAVGAMLNYITMTVISGYLYSYIKPTVDIKTITNPAVRLHIAILNETTE